LIGRTVYPPNIADGRPAEYSRQESHDFPSKVRGLAVTPPGNAMMIDRFIIRASSTMTIDRSCNHLIVSFNVTPRGRQVAMDCQHDMGFGLTPREFVPEC